MLYLNDAQRQMLLSRLPSNRVAHRNVGGKNLSYVEASDIKRWLIRVFGFGGFEVNVRDMDLVFEEQRDGKWHVGYRCLLTLTLHTLENGHQGYTDYTEAAVGFATLGSRGEAHDMACKTAESDALKRCAIYLGTTFGLSLYFNTNEDVVIRTLDQAQEGAGEAIPVESDRQAIPEVSEPQEPAQEPGQSLPAEGVQPLDATDKAVQTLSDAGMTAEAPAPTTGAEATWFDSLRAAAMNPDEAERVRQTVALQKIAVEQFGEQFLDRVQTVKGAEMTVRNLIVECSAGRFLS